VLQAGQEQTRFRLRAGEEVRTPLIVLQFWHGDWVSAQNLWRRWMVAHNLPRPGGQLAPPQLVACNSHQFNEMLGANEQNQKLFIDRYLANGLKIDYWWMDAGWYKNSGTWVNTGTWEVDPKRFPGGLRAITDHGHAKGVKSIVWFEPERVTPGTWLYDRHPEWLLRASPDLNDPLAGLGSRRATELPGTDPCVTHNPTSKTRSVASVRWEPGRLAFHPGPQGEYSVVRWTGLTTGEYAVQAEFLAIDEQTTTDVHVLHGGRSVFTDRINLDGRGRRAVYEGTLKLAQGGTLDFVVGWGNGTHASDSTGLAAVLRDPTGKTHDAAKDFHLEANPNGPWSYGYLKPGPTPDSSTFRPYDHHETIGDNGWRLLNLGDLAARTWLTDHVDRLIRDQGIDLYRQDFNIDPLPYWRSADAEDRQGITEIRYVEGYLAYWDELRRRHPTMLIDSCASGGRRNDLETLRRAVPLVRSDHLFEPTSQQCHTYGISFWYPYHGTGTLAGESKILNAADAAVQQFDVYAFRSHMAASVTACWDVRRDDLDYAELRRLAGQLRTVQPCYLGDYYPLTTYSTANDAWMAWQFDLPQQGCGMVQAFRRPQSTQAGACYKLLGLDAQATYVVRDLDTPDQPAERSGGELMQDGLAVSILKQPGAAVVTYQKK
jgi:alpha-galactosidase